MRSREAARPTFALHSPGQVLTLFAFGATLGAAVLVAINYRRLGLLPVTRSTLAVAIAIFVADLALALMAIPPFFKLLLAFGGAHAAIRDGSLFDRHEAAGGTRAASWPVLLALVVDLILTELLYALILTG